MKRHTQLVLLAVVTLAIAATRWWLSSPEAAARAGKAIVILVTAVCCVGHCRRWLPSRSPIVLCTTLIGLGVVVFAKPTGPLFPTAIAVLTGLAWTGVLVARGAEPYVRSKTVVSVLAQLIGRRRTLRCLDQASFAERHTVPHCEH